MAKRKTSCGNARVCSMLPTNVTRSASYEALPNHRPFPAKSGLTGRFPLRNRCRREEADETASDLVWKSEMRLRRGKSGDTVGRPSWRSSLLGDPGAKFLVENPTNEKLTKFREHLSQSR